MANMTVLPVYGINSSQRFTAPNYYGFPSSGVFAQPVNIPNNNINGALIYSQFRTSVTGTDMFYTTLTVAQIVTALG